MCVVFYQVCGTGQHASVVRNEAGYSRSLAKAGVKPGLLD